MKLVTVAEPHLLELMHWFPDRRSCTVWSGPEVRYPFTEATFREDIRFQLSSYSLIGNEGELLGFGQYYLRAERCHLSRLVIAPHHRGRAAGAFLIRELSRRGCSELRVDDCSLFVLESNTPAVRLYSRLGFRATVYPGEAPPIEGCVYMVATAEQINGENVVTPEKENNVQSHHDRFKRHRAIKTLL
jgi:ribosomal protein S18 acetylase RimI-like enzyme